MIIFIPVFLLLIAAVLILMLNRGKTRLGVLWMIGWGAALLAWLVLVATWLSTKITVLSLQVSVLQGELDTIFPYGLKWLLDDYPFPYAFGILTLLLAVLLAASVRTRLITSPRSWATTLTLTALCLIGIMSANPFTLAVSWVLMDVIEFAYLLGISNKENLNRIMLNLVMRLAAVMMLVWATAFGQAYYGFFDIIKFHPRAGFFFLLAIGLRLGVLPISLPFSQEPDLQRGTGLILRLLPVASALAFLGRLPAQTIEYRPGWTIPLQILVAAAAMYASVRWLIAKDEMEGRPYWILALSSLAMACVVNARPAASLVWGEVMLLCGGVLFLFHPRIKRIRFLLFFSLFGLLLLPYLTYNNGWQGLVGDGLNFWRLLLIAASAMVVLGYLRQVLRPAVSNIVLDPWARLAYPAGLIMLVQANFVIGFININLETLRQAWWVGALQMGMVVGGILFALVLGVRVNTLEISGTGRLAKISTSILTVFDRVLQFGWFFRLCGWVFKRFSTLITFFSAVLEGDAGILWALLLMILLISMLGNTTG